MNTHVTGKPLVASDHASDRGSALVMVLVGMTIMGMFATVALTYSTQTLKVTRHSQDSISSLAAARAGVDEYLSRLNRDDYYWEALDCANTAMKKPVSGTNACGWTPTTTVGWAVVPGATVTPGVTASYHYDVDATDTPIDGTIDLRVTGKANKINRTIQVTLRRAGFGEFLYYTNYETVDPASEPAYGFNNLTAFDKCAHYFWEPVTPTSKPRPDPPQKANGGVWTRTTDGPKYCTDIKFSGGDVINGPTHSNDAIFMFGSPEFKGTVSTSYPACRPVGGVSPGDASCYRGPATPVLSKGIVYKDPIAMPTSIGSLKMHTDATQTTTPGCLYTGPTRIKFLIVGGLPKMKVWSPYSRSALNPNCGTPGDASVWPQTLNVPPKNIIIVQDVPSSQGPPTGGSCAGGTIGDGLPISNDVTQTLRESDCRYGNAYIEGDVAGKLTVAADNNIVITGNLQYSGGAAAGHVLGLIATNSVKIYHPTRCTGTDSDGRCDTFVNLDRPNSAGKFVDPIVQAAILTLQHSFSVEYYEGGAPLGDLNLFGSFAQQYRGPVGQFNTNTGLQVTGYHKAYVYDKRLRYLTPPYFLDPVHAAWGVKTFGELSAAYKGS